MKNYSINRIYHPYWLWEETKFNMWGSVEDREFYLQKVKDLTSNHKLFGEYMMKVVKEWKYSCEHNLSCIGQNRRAWIGQASCAYALKCPEDIVREVWWYLSTEQRDLANQEADKAIKYWEQKYEQKNNKKSKRIRSVYSQNKLDI
jgi:hypothetical protein